MRWLMVMIMLIVFEQGWCQLPDNPCPNIFQYKSDGGVYYGEIRIPYDGSKELNLAVNVSLAGIFRSPKLQLDLLTPTDKLLSSTEIQYRINFPFQNNIPKITQIVFNNQTYCYGPAEPVTPNGVTNLWSSIHFRINQFTYSFQNGLNDLTSQLQNNQNNFLNKFQNPQFQNPVSNQFNFQPPQMYPTTGPPPPSRTSTEDVCGIANNIQTLVVKGEKTRENEYPWLVAMFFRDKVSYQFSCTANLISAQHVITAGHCVRFYKADLIAKEDILLVLGRSDISHWATSGGLIRTAMEVIPHPEYTQGSGHGDIAIIKMNEEITFKNTARPICLWNTDENLKNVVGNEGVVAGWGRTENANSVPETRRVNLPIVSQEDCLRSNSNFKNLTSDKTFCAGHRDGKGPCSGDSGAAFMMKRSGRWFLRGLVSRAIKNQDFTCDLNEYVVFSDAAKLKDWILGVIR